jgi:3-dehydroquinate synthase
MSEFEFSLSRAPSRCRIRIGYDYAVNLSRTMSNSNGHSVFVLTDSNVERLHPPVFASLQKSARFRGTFVLPPGERTKSITYIMRIHEWLMASGADRDSELLGIGGGVICDVAGFVAATFMRGISHSLVPTTLLAQIDAAVGGKNGINLPHAKNSVGTIKQPNSLIIDPVFLSTLTVARLKEGLVELMKMALIRSKRLYRLFSGSPATSLLQTREKVLSLLELGVRSKLVIVRRDERESGLRKILNFGHTTAHALESCAGYRTRMTHGKAVAFGMLVASRLSRTILGLRRDVETQIGDWIGGLYKSFPVQSGNSMDIWKIIGNDKKRSGAELNFVLLSDLHEPAVKPVRKSDFRCAYVEVAKEWSKAS